MQKIFHTLSGRAVIAAACGKGRLFPLPLQDQAGQGMRVGKILRAYIH